MRTQLTLYLFLLQLTLFGCAQEGQVDIDKRAQSQVEILSAKLANGEIRMVEIIQIPPLVETPLSITPETLENGFEYKLTISDIRFGPYGDELAGAIKSTAVTKHFKMPDLRWGIILYGLKSERLGTIYFDKWGRNGAVGNIPVSFEGDLFRWLNKNFSKCFR